MEFVSDGAIQLTGYNYEEFVSRREISYAALIHEADRAAVWESIQAALRDGVGFQLEYRIHSRDGTKKWVWERGEGVRSTEGRLLFLEGFITDITTRKKTEDALKAREEQFRALVETTTDLIWEVDLQGRFRYLSPQIKALLGYEADELFGEPCFSLCTPDEAERMSRLFRRDAETGKPLLNERMTVRHRDGREYVWELSSTPVRDATGAHTGFRGINRDVTHVIEAERRLREQEANFRAIAGNAFDGILISLDDQSHAYSNPRASEISGYSAVELKGIGLDHLIAGEEGSNLEPRISGGKRLKTKPDRFIADLRRKDGRSIPVELTLTPTLWRGQQARLIFMNDISERRALERRIEADVREKTILLKEVHHRVKNNLQIIVSLLNLQSERIDDARIHSVFAEIRDRIYSMALLHEKLYMSENFAEISFQEYLPVLCREILDTLSDENRLSLAFDIDDIRLGIDSAVPCGLIVNEIVTNAVKHAFPNPRRGIISVGFKRGKRNEIALTVRDDGIGLPPGFDYRTTESLGLTVIRILVQQLDGDLKITSGQGTTYHLVFPDEG
jgi:PAS domain S-box-containing protein